MKIRRTKLDAEAAQADLLVQLRHKGIPLSDKDTKVLIDKGLIRVAETAIEQDDEKVFLKLDVSKIFRTNKILHPIEIEADKRIRVIQPTKLKKDRLTTPGRVLTAELHSKELNECAIFFGKERVIKKKDWLPESVEVHTKEFKDWIDSINEPDGFWNMRPYPLFSLYVQQAEQWEREYQSEDQTNIEWQTRELERMDENSMYALNKYLELDEASDKGMKKYKATLAHQILLYLLDSMYSGDVAKARQIAFTTTFTGWAMIKCILNINYKIKYISENVPKAESTISEKLKYPYAKMPTWARPEVLNDWASGLYLAKRVSKGVLEGNNSVIEVLPPTETAVASSTPDVTFVDEIGQISHIQSIESDVEPTLYGYNPTTQKQERLRIYWQWGTGGNMNGQAGQAFQSVFLNHLSKWKETNTATVIPLVFNVWYRPGWTKEKQESLRLEAYLATGPEAETKRTKFHQGYPETLDDIFKTSGNTIVSEEYIQSALARIKAAGAKAQPVYGRFEPIYDTTKPAHEGSDVPYKITGAQFIPMKKSEGGWTAIIFDNRRLWRNRYYQGTDPISSKSGQSNMASVIWDAFWSAPVALVNCRHQGDPRKDFLQVTLMGMYYDVEGNDGAVPELVEANIGGSYIEYKTNKGLEKTLVIESELPNAMISKQSSIGTGIDNKGLRNDAIITYMKNIILTYGDNIWIPLFFEQMRTFVEKIRNNTTVWEPIDKRMNRDDALFGLTYSYICSLCYSQRKPEEIQERTSVKTVNNWKRVRQPDGTLKGQMVRTKVQNIRPEIVRQRL